MPIIANIQVMNKIIYSVCVCVYSLKFSGRLCKKLLKMPISTVYFQSFGRVLVILRGFFIHFFLELKVEPGTFAHAKQMLLNTNFHQQSYYMCFCSIFFTWKTTLFWREKRDELNANTARGNPRVHARIPQSVGHRVKAIS